MSRPNEKKQRIRVFWLLPPLLLVVLGVAFFSSTGRDDAYITFWPAFSLAEYGQMINYNGERVEQSSSLLQVLLIALFRRLTGIDIVYLGYLVSIFSGALSVYFAMKLSSSMRREGYLIAGLLTATSTYLVYWSFGGMEPTLNAVFFLLTIQSYAIFLNQPDIKFWPSGQFMVVTMLFLISRPESPVVLAMVQFLLISCLGPFGQQSKDIMESQGIFKNRHKKILLSTVILAFNAIGLFTFRKIYFNSVFPQPVLAKADRWLTWKAITRGFKYLAYTMNWHPLMTILSLIMVAGITLIAIRWIKSCRVKTQLLLMFFFATAQVTFIIFSGGDWMEGGRFFVPLLPIISALLAAALLTFFQKRSILVISVSLLIILQLGITAKFAVGKSTGLTIWPAVQCYRSFGRNFDIDDYTWFERTNQTHLRDITLLESLHQLVPQLQRKTGKICVITGAMGMVPYHLAIKYGYNSFYFLDLYALADKNFTTCPVTASLPRDSMGLDLSLKKFLTLWPRLSGECRIPEPDMLFGSYQGQADLDFYEAHGYRVVYTQEEYAKNIIPPKLLRPQFRMFIAVHKKYST